MAISFLFVGTEDFYKEWGSCPPKQKLEECRNYSEDLWTKFIENGSGNFVGNFAISNKKIPMNSAPVLSKRMMEARDWCRRNWCDIQQPDAIAVIDYFIQKDAQGSKAPPGLALLGTAGGQSCISISNMYDVDRNDALCSYSRVGARGYVHHELGHLFDCDHPKDVSAMSDGEVSQMYSPIDDVGCTDTPDEPLIVTNWHGICTRQTIHQFVNTHNSLP